jgi:hypothetical protein
MTLRGDDADRPLWAGAPDEHLCGHCRRRQAAPHPEATTPSTIGQLEERAGIAADHSSRFAFWIRYAQCADPITAGVAELREMIRQKAAAADAATALEQARQRRERRA